MTTQELRAAAERLASEDASAYPRHGNAYALTDAVALARAWLAEHPADDEEPISQSWLLASGWAKVDYSWAGQVQCFEIANWGIHWIEGGWGLFYLTADGFDGSETWLSHMNTRGCVRRLCAALEIELKEPA